MGFSLSTLRLPIMSFLFGDDESCFPFVNTEAVEHELQIVMARALIPKDTIIRHLQLYQAAMRGDWKNAEEILQLYPEDKTAMISQDWDRLIHVAVLAQRVDFVKVLVSMMSGEDLALKNKAGNTAFCLAATTGIVELAQVMMEKNDTLAATPGSHGMLPIHMAALLRQKEMVSYLYDVSKAHLNDMHRIELLIILINTDTYDVALKLLMKNPELAKMRNQRNDTALHVLARKTLSSPKQGFLKKCLNLITRSSLLQNGEPNVQAIELVEWLWKQVISLTDHQISKLIDNPQSIILDAAEHGNSLFLTVLIREYPHLIWKLDRSRKSIFHVAILHRHVDIYKLIYEIGSIKDLITAFKDDKGNSMLHLAGRLAPAKQLNMISGAALQLQWELLWFKEVKNIVPPTIVEDRNTDGDTASDIFTRDHKYLLDKAEKWMRDTASSCMVVVTLIATVVFAAAFTVPGGNKDDTGVPHFLREVSFRIFAVADAISLASSTISITTFLSILTSTYAEEDFLSMLPRKLVFGLVTLFISMTAMMVVFCATFFIIFEQQKLWITIVVPVISFLPIILFLWQQHRLIWNVLGSIYRTKSLFRASRPTLFDDTAKPLRRRN